MTQDELQERMRRLIVDELGIEHVNRDELEIISFNLLQLVNQYIAEVLAE